MIGLTKRQAAVFRLVESRCSAGVPPTFREIGELLGIPNVSAVAKHVSALQRKGLLGRTAGKSRSLRVLRNQNEPSCHVAHVPLLGTIPAGHAQRKEQDSGSHISTTPRWLGFRPSEKTFALTVSGESMIGRHIIPGDVVVLESGSEPMPGDIVAALIDGESSLKTFVRKNGKVFLKSENPKYPDLIPAEELIIQGVFRALIRTGKV